MLCRQQTKEEDGRSKELVEAMVMVQERDDGGLDQVVLVRGSQ